MGLEPAYIPLIIGAVGAAGKVANDEHARRKQDRQLAVGITQQGEKQKQAAGEVNALVNKRAKSNSNSARAAGESQLMETLRRNKGAGAVPGVLGASDRYRSNVAEGNASVGDFGSQLGNDMAAVDAASTQRVEEGMDQQRTGSAIGKIQRDAAGDDFVNQLRTRAITPNPLVGLAASMAQNYGSALAMKGPPLKGLPPGFKPNLTPTYDSDPLRAFT